MTTHSNPVDPGASYAGVSLGISRTAESCAPELMSPLLYDLVMWGFAETNGSGQRVLRRDIQVCLDRHELTEQEIADFEGTPLYVGFRCQPCWEAAVSHLAYGYHLCASRGQPMDPPSL
jgi:hypothetical protein